MTGYEAAEAQEMKNLLPQRDFSSKKLGNFRIIE